jgi:cation:H+ antiporter
MLRPLMLSNWLAICVGAALLAYCGNRLVDGAAALATKARLTPAVIGLTVVAAGTSAPELLVSVVAAARGSSAIAIGNVVGSNVANIGLILGLAALIAPLPVARKLLRLEYPFLVLATWIAVLLFRDGLLDRLEAAFFLASVAAFMGYCVLLARAAVEPGEGRIVVDAVPEQAGRLSVRPVGILLGGVALALAGLLLGAQALVQGAQSLAHALGVSERLVGLTIVAVGTSLPELAVTLAAAYKGHQEMAVATIVGSNIFNLLMILGSAGMVRPLTLDSRTIGVDVWVMMGLTALLFPLVRARRLSRTGGASLLVVYACYVAWLASHAS